MAIKKSYDYDKEHINVSHSIFMLMAMEIGFWNHGFEPKFSLS